MHDTISSPNVTGPKVSDPETGSTIAEALTGQEHTGIGRTQFPKGKGRRLFGCLSIAIVTIFACSWLWTRASATLQWGCGETVLVIAEKACIQCGLTNDQQARIMAPLKPFAQGIEQGRISMGLGLAVIRKFDDGPLFVALFCSGMSDRLSEIGIASDTVQVHCSGLVSTFYSLYKNDRIGSGTIGKLQNFLMAKREITFKRPSGMIIRERMRVLKPGFTAEERDKAIDLISEAVASGTPKTETPAEARMETAPPLDPPTEVAKYLASIQSFSVAHQ